MKNPTLLLKPRILLLFALLCAAVGSVQLVNAATFTVINTNDSGAGSLRQALADANDGDTINFDPSLNGQTITLTSGQLVVNKSLNITGPGPNQLTVARSSANGTPNFRIFLINPGKTVSISGLTMTNGQPSGNFPDDSGGGIYNDHATLTMNNCTLSGNSAIWGGGIYNAGFNPGGSAALTVSNSTVSGNSANQTIGRGGGGIYNDGDNNGSATLAISNSTLSSNSAPYGGGIVNDGTFAGNAALTIDNCTITANSAMGTGSAFGGGIYNDGDSGGSATLSISNSTVSGNSAGQGGGIVSNATVTINNSTLSGNTALNSGGGILNRGALSVSNSTISSNSALSSLSFPSGGGGIFTAGTLTILSSTVKDNSNPVFNGSGGILNYGISGSSVVNIGSTILQTSASGYNLGFFGTESTYNSLGYNLSNDSGGGFLTGAGDQINTDPLLGPLQDNGGPTFTHELLTGSPAIDQGKNFSGSTTDQRGTGFARTVDLGFPKPTGGDGTDIGSFEVQSSAPCPQPQGYWKNNPDAWPVNSLTLGSQTYTETELLTILKTRIGSGPKADASLILADQLIAAKLNIENGADGTPASSTITHADSLLSGYSGKLPYKVRTSTANGQAMVNDAATLESFNNGALTAGCGL